MEAQMRTRYYVVNKNDEPARSMDDNNNDGPTKTILPMLGLTLNGTKNNKNKGITSDLKHADDGEIYLADSEPGFLFDDWERRKHAALIGFELTIPAVISHDDDDDDVVETSGTNNKKKKKDVPTDTDDSGDDQADNSSDQSNDNNNKKKTTGTSTRRVPSNTRRAALMRQSSKRPNNATPMTTTTTNTDTTSTTLGGGRSSLLKSESRRNMSSKPSSELSRSTSSESASTDRRTLSNNTKSRRNSEDNNNAVITTKNSQKSAVTSTTTSNNSTTTSKSVDNPETLLYDLLNNIDPLKSNGRNSKLDEEKIIELLEKYPKIVTKKYDFYNIYTSGDTVYPLHMLCCFGASLVTIKLCYKLYAEAIDYISNNREMTCLHYAVLYTRSSLDVIQFIIKKDPISILSLTKKQQTPLHIACNSSPNIKTYNPQVIMLLTELLPTKDNLLEVDKHGRTPLHIACGLDEPCLEVIEDLTEVNNNACIIQCYDYHSTPLHLACSNRYVYNENHKIVNIIKDIIRSNPSAVKMKDINGQLPISVAVTNKACYKICKMLIKKYPICLEMTVDNKGMTLYELGKKRQLDKDTIELLNPYED